MTPVKRAPRWAIATAGLPPVDGLWHGEPGDKGSHSEEAAAGVGPDAAPRGDRRLGNDYRRFEILIPRWQEVCVAVCVARRCAIKCFCDIYTFAIYTLTSVF